MLHNLKKGLSKVYTVLSTAIVVLLLFVLQFVIIDGNFEFYKDTSFWTNYAVMIVILITINEIYWRNGSKRGELNDRYIGSAVEYSVRINRIKNYNPCKTEDFYKYIDEKNVELFIDARNEYLDKNGVLKDDYYCGHDIKVNDDGKIEKSKPHCEMSKSELKKLKKNSATGEEIPYYSRKQIKAICNAVCGKFHYEVLNGTEILSGIKIKNNKYATSYNAAKNKARFASTSIITSGVCAVLGAMLIVELQDWNVSALFVFAYRVFLVIWRAIVSDDAGYSDIINTKRGVNINRANIATMYATARQLDDLFLNINLEIAAAKEQFITPTLLREDTKRGNSNRPDSNAGSSSTN